MVFRSDILEVNLAASCKILILLLASLTISSVFLFHFKSDVMIVPEAVGETLQKKDVEINLLRKQITDYGRERRNISKAIVAMKKINVPKHNPNGAPKAQLVEKWYGYTGSLR